MNLRVRGAAAAVGLALLLAGCSSAEPEPIAEPASPTPSTPSETPVASPTPEPSPAGTPSVALGSEVATGLPAPWSVAVLDDNAALVSLRNSGEVQLLRRAGGSWDRRVAGSVPGAAASGEGGLLGLAVAPSGEQVYAMYTGATDNRVVRMPWDGERLGEPVPVITGIPKASIHNGGRIAFGPDGMLYVATGDAAVPESAQNPGSLSGKILRIAPDGSIPADNPTPGSAVYSLGHRNVQGLAFDDDGRLWATEFGAKDVDEVNLITPGSNYGWPIVEGPAGRPGLVDPAASWSPTSIASPSGAAYADGSLWVATLRGRTLYQVPLNGESAATPIAHFGGELGRLRDVVNGPSGGLWLVTNNTDGRGDPRAGDDRIIALRIVPAG